MYCPQCGTEYREGFTVCDECNVPLTPDPPTVVDHEAPEYVTVLETSQVSVLPVIRSVLDGADIPYIVEGEDMLELFPSEALGTIMSKPHAQVQFKVPADRAAVARELLDAHPEDFIGQAPELQGDDEPYTES